MLASYLIKEYPEQYKVFGQKEFPLTASTNSTIASRCWAPTLASTA